MGSHSSPDLAAQALATVLADLTDVPVMQDFLKDLCTPAELIAMAERLRIVSLLNTGASYREVAEQAGVSVTTVGRVARSMRYGSGGYKKVLDKKESS